MLKPKLTAGNLQIKQRDPNLKAVLLPFIKGDKGEKGDPGVSGAGFGYTQALPSAVWTIAHNLGFRPAASAYTVGGVEMWGTVTHISNDVLQFDFSTPVAGTARLT